MTAEKLTAVALAQQVGWVAPSAENRKMAEMLLNQLFLVLPEEERVEFLAYAFERVERYGAKKRGESVEDFLKKQIIKTLLTPP